MGSVRNYRCSLEELLRAGTSREQEGSGHMQVVHASFLLAAASIAFSILDPFGSPEPPHPLSRCSIKHLNASGLSLQDLAVVLASAREPVLITGLNSSSDLFPCSTISSCVDLYGDTALGLSTSTSSGGRMLMNMREYVDAILADNLPPDTYSFYRLRASKGGQRMAHDFKALKDIFLGVMSVQHPELSKVAAVLPDTADALYNISMRVALGGVSTGSSRHGHGSALLAIAAGSKTWFIRDSTRTLPARLEKTLKQGGGQKPLSTLEWVQAANSASPGDEEPFGWLGHMWHCTQSAGELMYIPPGLRHAIYNLDVTMAVAVQVDMQVTGSALHVTSFHGLLNATKVLLDSGADVNAKAGNGGTPLHHAAAFGHEDAARLLLGAGAKLDVVDSRSATPLDVASGEGMTQLLKDALRPSE